MSDQEHVAKAARTNLAPDSPTKGTQALPSAFLSHLRMIASLREGSRRDPLWVWESHEELLLSMAGDPVVVDRLTLPEGIQAGAVKECFYNAFMATLTDPNLTYTEGYAMSAGLFPVNHAWVTGPEGNVTDPTWVNLNSRDRPTIYLGLRFSRSFMSKVLSEGNDFPSVFEADWRRKGKSLRCGFILDASGDVVDWGDPPPF